MKRKLLVLVAFVGAMFALSIGVSAVAWNPGGPECVGVDTTVHPDCIPTTTTQPTTTTTPTDTTPTDTTPTQTAPPEATTTTGTVPTPPVEAGTTPKAEKAAKRAQAVASSPGNESLQVAQLGG